MVAHIKKRLIECNLDISKLLGRSWNLGRTSKCSHTYTKKTFSDRFLIKNSPFIRTVILKERLLKFRLKNYQCEDCGNTGVWNGVSLVLQLDHVDGDSSNNELSNLKIRCPNCHSQTPTYSGKNNRKHPVDRGTPS